MDNARPILAKTGWTRNNPYHATMTENRVISGPKSAHDIRHIVFELADSGITYKAGDALGVIPVNAPDLVELWLKRLGVTAETMIPGKDAPLGKLLSTGLEIVKPSKELLRGLEPLIKNAELSRVLRGGDQDAIDVYLWGKGALDLMNLAPDLALDPAQIIGWLKPLHHRAYSISSSPKAHPGEIHLTVAAVRWTYHDRPHRGVCSTYLADRVPIGESAGVFLISNRYFCVPDDDGAPMIMVGPGTGIAPFRAFLQERRERGATGTNWLFFGDQHRENDFLYEQEIMDMNASGLLNRLDLAFSRDQDEKVYVQHRMEENGKDLYGTLEEGGYFFVCGDATHMAQDVEIALHNIIKNHSGLDSDAAAEYVNHLKRERRYVRDVY